MTHFPPPVLHEKRKRVLRYIGIALSALMVLTVMTVFALILRNEFAHQEDKCPFQPTGERAFPGGKIVEQHRTCVAGISEHRYFLERDGKQGFELARKRLATDRFEPNRYHWNLSQDDKQRVVLKVMVDGKLSSEFREEDAQPQR